MTKKTLLTGFLAIAGTGALLVSCHDDIANGNGTGVGLINPAVDLNTTVINSQKGSRAKDVSASDLALKITSADGSYSHTWASLSEFDATTTFNVGEYTVEAYYGSVDDEGFDRPAYYGSQTVTVLENQTTPVAITATLANAMVSIDYTDDFRDYMSSWNAELHSTGGGYLYYGPDETSPIYVKPGEITMDLNIIKPNNTSATLRVATFTAKARYHYHVTVGLDGQTGTATLTITFDESLAQETIVIDISDEIINAPAPVIKGTGIENGGTINYLEGSTPSKLTLDIVARGGIKSANLTTKSTSLISQGWPNEVDVAAADERTMGYMTSLGFVERGITGETGKFGVLDFTEVPQHLRSADVGSTNTFELRVVDKYGKVSDVFTFNLTMTELVLGLSNPGTISMAATDLDVDLSYNGNNVDDVKFQVLNSRGIWDDVTVANVTESGDNLYRVSLKVPATTSAVTLRAKSGSKVSQQLVVNRTGATDFAISAPEADIWTNRANIVLSSETADAAILASNATVYISTDGTNYTPATVSATNGATLTITGLTPGTAYYAKASVTELESQSCTAIRFATETAADVPNGDFENIAETYNESKVDQGGLWSISAGINYQTTATYIISEATGWATTNAKTMSGSTNNVWFRQPSVFNTTLTYSSTVPKIYVISTGGGTETPAAYTGFSAHNGSNAMVVRNVGWDPAGNVPSTWRKEFADKSDYYNHTVPAISRHSVGKMFLGSYSYDNGTETYNEGVEFASRPSAMTGWYTFTPDAGDTEDHGVVTVTVLNGSTVIAQGSANLATASSYTQFNVPLTYIANAPKATSVCVMVASSKYASTIDSETSNVKVTTYNSRYESYQHGATLVVDDFKFIY